MIEGKFCSLVQEVTLARELKSVLDFSAVYTCVALTVFIWLTSFIKISGIYWILVAEVKTLVMLMFVCVCVCVSIYVLKLGPSLIGALKKDWASPNSIALSWQQPEQTSLPVLDYEIKYYEKVQFLPECLKCCWYLSAKNLARNLWFKENFRPHRYVKLIFYWRFIMNSTEMSNLGSLQTILMAFAIILAQQYSTLIKQSHTTLLTLELFPAKTSIMLSK